ncbi:MAG: hypothetical protein V4704_04645 [Pseudomonadota bacterium]
MSLTPSPLALALALAIAATVPVASAQSLPRRVNLEHATHGEAWRDVARDRHVFRVGPGQPVLAPLDGGRLIDVQLLDGPAPDIWTSQGGALLVRQAPQSVDSRTQVVDTFGGGRRWLRLEGEASAQAVVHARIDGRRGGSDPWLVPLAPLETLLPRTRPGRRDHVLRQEDAPARYPVQGGPLRLDVWRVQRLGLLPPDATWLRIEADGRVLFDGRVATPVERERMHVTDGCADVLDLAGRVRVDVPAGTRELRVHGERGTWLKVLAPLPGTPVEALAVASDAARESLLPDPGELVEQAFGRAVLAYPEPRANAFLARYSYLRPVALRPQGSEGLTTRAWRPRFADRDGRGAFPTRPPEPGETPISPVAFHWMPAGARWRIDTATPGRAGLLRIAVAHAEPSSAGTRLRLEQAGHPAVDLRLDPEIVGAMRTASSEADGLLALAPDGPAIVDASQVVLRREDVASHATLVNVGGHGAWVTVDQRVPAPRQLAEPAHMAPLLAPEQLQDALVEARAAGQDDAASPASTRDVDYVRRLLAARAARFAAEPCVQAVNGVPGEAERALELLGKAQDLDPLLARCAAQQAFAAAPEAPGVHAALDAWAMHADQSELRTGAYAWAVQAPARRRDRAAWARLARALAEEGEGMAALVASHAAGSSLRLRPDGPMVASVPADRAAAAVRLRTEREIEVAYARADASQPARWSLDRAGAHTLELRATGDVPQWVRLQSGARAWWVLLPPAQADASALRDTASGAAPGLAVRVRLEVPTGGAAVSVEPDAGVVLARLEAPLLPASSLPPGLPVGGAAYPRAIELEVADACRVVHLRPSLAIHLPGSPAASPRSAGSITLHADAPAIEERATPRTATQAALQALRLIEAGRFPAAEAAAARAYALRETDAVPPAPGVFPELERHVEFRRVTPVSHGGVLHRHVADGRSSQPLLARRERWAGLEDEQAFVLRPGQAWVLEGLQPGQQVRLMLRAQAALSDQVEVRTTRGDLRRIRRGETTRVSDTADARGELHLRLGEALPGTFVALELADADGTALDGRRAITYHRGPVALRIERPTVLRITEWDGVRSEVSTQRVDSPGLVRVQPSRPGAALLVRALALEPAAPHSITRKSSVEVLPPASIASAPMEDSATVLEPWPRAWANSGGEDGTWGLQASWQQRTDADDGDDQQEQFHELRWRWRWNAPVAGGLWGRLDVIGRRHEAGFGVVGLQHDLQWSQADGPWGASLDAAAWRQSTPAGLGSTANAASVRAAVEWSRRRDERWRDEWSLGLRWRELSLRDVDRAFAARLDNDVYSRYRDRHRRQLDLGYRLAWRAHYDSEWIVDAQAVSNDLSTADLDHVGAGLQWRWARHGWTASAGLDVRRYLHDADRRVAFTRERVELAIGRILLGADDGWRLRLAGGYDAGTRQAYGGITVEWFDHDGRGLVDFAPSELFLRGVTETDLAARLLAPETPP